MGIFVWLARMGFPYSRLITVRLKYRRLHDHANNNKKVLGSFLPVSFMKVIGYETHFG